MEQTNTGSQKYWMSLEQWRHDPEFQKLAEQEFLSSPLREENGEGGWARREFLKLMGASLALTTFGCVRRPAQKIIPYAKKPADVVHGLPNYYASSFADGLEGLGILVTTRDGRPIKIEGNPDHPTTEGGMSVRAHSHILKLYDPDRFTQPKRNLQNEARTNRETVNVKWDVLDKDVSAQLNKGGVHVLMAHHLSPSTQEVVDDFTSAFNAKVYHYDDLSYDAVIEAQQMSYGQRALPRYRIDKAKYIVAVNNDFLGTWMTPTAFQKQFAMGRKADADMNKLVVFESLMSLTGTNADQRFRIRPSQSLGVVLALLHELIVNKKVSRYAGDQSVMRSLSEHVKGQDLGFSVSEVAEELWKNRGQSLVLGGGLTAQTEDAVALQIAVNFLNAVLDNDGKTVDGTGANVASLKSSSRGMDELMTAIKAGQVKTLIIHGCNPLYSSPHAGDLQAALAKVETVIYTGDRNDETARYADIVAIDHHPLENWGDMRSVDGVLSIQQPTIQPLYDSRAFQESLMQWMKTAGKGSARVRNSGTWYDYLRSNWRDNLSRGHSSKGFEEFWLDLLESGVANKPTPLSGRSFNISAFSKIKPSDKKTGFELALYATVGLGDGSLANVSWLQEFPDPVTKICWDNYACFSLKDAAQLKLKEGRMVTLTVGESVATVPVHIQPGQAEGVVGLAIGYGRKGAGQIADGVGVPAMGLAQWKNGLPVTAGLVTSVKVEAAHRDLACTQGHHTMEGRQIVVEETLADHIQKPGGNVHRHHMKTMWSEHKYNGNKWGMVIDLNSCTGCGACVIACQSENNIPTVGRKFVLQGREMHWLRIDRYYTGGPEDPDVVHQPVPCMHCDNAPCETVCPVIATAHSDEGTNDMIYNRCVGTRYCANNCPYKVRRFNWFDYTQVQAPKHLALNPEVTVRNRGVMEKCTFCIHRIRHTKMEAKSQDRSLRRDEVQTACQQSCPSKCITFGDLNDKESAVAQQFHAEKSYALLEELNTKPAVHYQVKVRNTDHLKGGSKHHGEGH